MTSHIKCNILYGIQDLNKHGIIHGIPDLNSVSLKLSQILMWHSIYKDDIFVSNLDLTQYPHRHSRLNNTILINCFILNANNIIFSFNIQSDTPQYVYK